MDGGDEPIFFTGPIKVDGQVTDALFNIVTETHPVLYRDVQVYQWVETSQ